jgi:hypothetical protein
MDPVLVSEMDMDDLLKSLAAESSKADAASPVQLLPRHGTCMDDPPLVKVQCDLKENEIFAIDRFEIISACKGQQWSCQSPLGFSVEFTLHSGDRLRWILQSSPKSDLMPTSFYTADIQLSPSAAKGSKSIKAILEFDAASSA